jgi:uncharacterized protein (TIGR03089 family)
VHQLTPEQAFDALLAADPGRPFVTYYDEATGERTELSAKSLANWVAKTHFLLIDELGLGVGDGALIDLPAHWVSVVPMLACCTAGLELVSSSATADVAFVSPASAGGADGVPDVYAIAPESAAVGFGAAVPDGTSDFVSAVRPQPDKWSTVRFGAGDADPLLGGRTRAETVDRACARAAELGVAEGARVLSTRDWTGPDAWCDTLFVPLVMRGSIVYVRNAPDDDVIERRVAQERASVRV